MYAHVKAAASSAHPTVATVHTTPAAMWPPAKLEMVLMRPAEPLEGTPTNE